jgi:hypothetical protein
MREPEKKLPKKNLFIICLVCVLIIISCTCMPIQEKAADPAAEQTMEVASAVPSIIPSQIPTEKPLPTATAKPPAATETDEPVLDMPVEARPWSLPAYPDAVLFLTDLDEDAEWDEIVKTHARNLAIEPPYYYEFYDLPGGTRYSDLRSFYQEELPTLGYKQAADMQGGSEIYLLTFVNASGSLSRKIVIQHWRLHDMAMVIYKNPE